DDANAMNQWAIGLYSVSLLVSSAKTPSWATNAVPIALSPLITVSPLGVSVGDTLTVTCTPRLQTDQQPGALLILGSQSVSADTINSPADVKQPTTLTFPVPQVAAGKYLVRLRVNGIDSLPIMIQGSKLAIDASQQVTVS